MTQVGACGDEAGVRMRDNLSLAIDDDDTAQPAEGQVHELLCQGGKADLADVDSVEASIRRDDWCPHREYGDLQAGRHANTPVGFLRLKNVLDARDLAA